MFNSFHFQMTSTRPVTALWHQRLWVPWISEIIWIYPLQITGILLISNVVIFYAGHLWTKIKTRHCWTTLQKWILNIHINLHGCQKWQRGCHTTIWFRYLTKRLICEPTNLLMIGFPRSFSWIRLRSHHHHPSNSQRLQRMLNMLQIKLHLRHLCNHQATCLLARQAFFHLRLHLAPPKFQWHNNNRLKRLSIYKLKVSHSILISFID